ncbi:MAG: tetratricopeptide repeat protein, partial [Chloroflexi bacterium]|nr:tetratricopeptide repeat protein [Chloroflexota bacterium]
HHEQSLLLSSRTGNLLTHAFALSFLGEVALRQQRLDEAKSLFSRSLVVRRDLEDRRGMAFSHLMLGDVALATGDASAANQSYQTSLETYRKIGDLWGVAEALLRLTQETLITKEAARPYFIQILQATRRTHSVDQVLTLFKRLEKWYGWTDLGETAVGDTSRYEKIESIVQKVLTRLLQ